MYRIARHSHSPSHGPLPVILAAREFLDPLAIRFCQFIGEIF
jgi:hypothetical protein